MTDDKDALLRDALPVLQAYARDNPKWYSIDLYGGPGILQDPEGVHALIPRITAALEGGKDGGWLPIETAPKDESRILLSDGSQVCSGSWKKVIEVNDVFVRRAKDGDVYQTVETDTGYFDSDICPTHWQPLPPLPTGDRHD